MSYQEWELILHQLSEVEPLLRATCTHVIDATLRPVEIVDRLTEIGRGSAS